TTGSTTPTSSERWRSSACAHRRSSSGWRARWRPRSRACARSSCTSLRAWPRRSIGPTRSPPSAVSTSTCTRSTSRWARCSSTARTRSGCASTGSTRSCGRRWHAVSDRGASDSTAGNAEWVADRVAVAFARVVRSAGLDVTVGNVTAFVEALEAVGVARRASVYWAGRATLVRCPEDSVTYDRAFHAFWGGGADTGAAPLPLEARVDLALDDLGDDRRAGEPTPAARPRVTVRYSPHEVLRHKDFAAYSHAEFAEARRLMADMRLAGRSEESRVGKGSRRR